METRCAFSGIAGKIWTVPALVAENRWGPDPQLLKDWLEKLRLGNDIESYVERRIYDTANETAGEKREYVVRFRDQPPRRIVTVCFANRTPPEDMVGHGEWYVFCRGQSGYMRRLVDLLQMVMADEEIGTGE
jgi:hypothetical protein